MHRLRSNFLENRALPQYENILESMQLKYRSKIGTASLSNTFAFPIQIGWMNMKAGYHMKQIAPFYILQGDPPLGSTPTLYSGETHKVA